MGGVCLLWSCHSYLTRTKLFEHVLKWGCYIDLGLKQKHHSLKMSKTEGIA